MSCSPRLCCISYCASQQSRLQSSCSRSCSRASSLCSRSSSPCSGPSSSCRSYVPCYPCTPCVCMPCLPCSPTTIKRKEKISDFIGSGVGAAQESDNWDKQKSKRDGRKNDSERNGRKRKRTDEGGSESGGGFREGKDDNVGEDTGGEGGSNVKKKGGGSGGEGGNERDGSEGAKIRKGKGRKGSNREVGNEDKKSSQDNLESKADTHDAATNKTDFADIGVCTPKLICVCPNPYCPSNIRKMRGQPAYTYASQTYGQNKLQCYCKGNKNKNPCPCKIRNNKPFPETSERKTQKCPKCGKRKRVDNGSNVGQCGDNFKAYYVRNENFTAQSGLSS